MTPVRVLVVDDCHDNADCVARLLRHLKCDVTVAYNGADALSLAGDIRPHAAFIDVAMPGVTGLSVAEAIRANAELASMFLIAMSGYVDLDTRKQVGAAGFDRFLSKPFMFGEVRDIIEPICNVAQCCS